MHSAALAAADSMLANWLPQAPAASRVALEQAQQFYTTQAVVALALFAFCCVAAGVLSVVMWKKATHEDTDQAMSEIVGPAAIVLGIAATVLFGCSVVCVPEAAAFLFAGKAATVLRLVGKF